MKRNISVILPVHSRIDAKHFEVAILSIINQSQKVFEIITVVDGPVSKALLDKINKFNEHELVNIIFSKTNNGPGFSRNIAINHSKGDIIALMDADDISRNNRFEIQLSHFLKNNNDMLGGLVSEFYETVGDSNFIRKVPTCYKEIKKNMAIRMPFNNVTLMFTRELYIKSGGYKNLKYLEDYELNFRMFLHSTNASNVNHILVDVRTERSNAQFIRRLGFDYFIEEVKLFHYMQKIKFISKSYFFFTIISRAVVRLGPKWISKYIYWKFRKKYNS
tara:strand:- start:406 stop:1233 length:828 start_codon:yes stop_codon:yes gene_type:complete